MEGSGGKTTTAVEAAPSPEVQRMPERTREAATDETATPQYKVDQPMFASGGAASVARRRYVEANIEESAYGTSTSGFHDYADAERAVSDRVAARELKNARQRGVDRAKAAERQLVQSGHPGTADGDGWTWAERKQIAETGQFPADVRMHHINDVKRFPELADNPDNVIPSRGGAAGHVKKYHPQGTRQGSKGTMLNRELLMTEHLGDK